MHDSFHRMDRCRAGGFSLVEVMITLFIAATFITMAVPAFQEVIEDTRATSQINTVSAALNLARSEANKRGDAVSICKTDDQSSCGDDTVSWAEGYVLFLNKDRDDPPEIDADEEIIRYFPALPGTSTLEGDWGGFAEGVTFLPDGSVTETGVFVVCQNWDPHTAKGVLVSLVGRIRTARDSNGDGYLEDSSGNVMSCWP
ncbi:MAG: GspH/FimT family pseudopilin [Magnetococcales bacterium]|nr:GspH/FimT family pseudopilin [Magnetococcales bacterium]